MISLRPRGWKWPRRLRRRDYVVFLASWAAIAGVIALITALR